MKEILARIAEAIALSIESAAVLAIAWGTLAALVGLVRSMPAPDDNRLRAIWLRYAQWLIAGLTLQLAGDIVHSAIAPTWDQVGHLAATAAIRTFLSYFLDRDIETIRRRQAEAGEL